VGRWGSDGEMAWISLKQKYYEHWENAGEYGSEHLNGTVVMGHEHLQGESGETEVLFARLG